METTSPHQPVMLKQVVDLLKPQPGQSYLDLTAGYGGHASAILAETKAPDQAVLVDRDQMAVDYLEDLFKLDSPRILHTDMVSALEQLKLEDQKFDMILLDVGVSSLQLDRIDRGFSFRADGPLDMRMDQTQELTAQKLLNSSTEQELVKILREYGEEPHAGRIAKAIIKARPLSSTQQLANVVSQTVGIRRSKGRMTNPSTRTFQAIRIAVNDELGQLATALSLTLEQLASGGRLAVISFHSLEDRLVKRVFAEHSGDRLDSSLKILTKNPLVPDKDDNNPRARSSKLRAAVKINTKIRHSPTGGGGKRKG